MTIRFAQADIDRFFAERDVQALYWVIGVLAQQQSLPEECWFFCRLLEWVGATRSGVWQHYEGLATETFVRMSRDLDEFGLPQLAERYRAGERAWQTPEQCEGLDRWLDAHEQEVYDAATAVLARRRDYFHRPA